MTDTAALSTGTGSSAGQERRVLFELSQTLALEHGDQPWQPGFEGVDRLGLVDAGDLEIQRQRTRRDTESDPPGIACPQPRDLLGDECGRAQGQEQRRGGRPTRVVLGQHERGHLQRLRHVSGEATVVLAGHDTVEAVSNAIPAWRHSSATTASAASSLCG